MTRVVLSTYRALQFLEGGGHFWVYMQYAHGLRSAGCDVYWLDSVRPGDNGHALAEFSRRLAPYGLDGKAVLMSEDGGFVGMSEDEAAELFAETDLLLNFRYAIDPELLARFRRAALVDIDPGLLQYWISEGMIPLHRHDHYFTIGETVGTPRAQFPDCGVEWTRIKPPVALDLWPERYDPAAEAFTTVSSWWAHEWIGDKETGYDNTKRSSFMEFVALPRLTSQPLELALFLVEYDDPERAELERIGWRVRHSRDVAATPEAYREYVQGSRGEFSAAKPSCMQFQNAWVSDRTICYLASGKPAVVQDTGPSEFLPSNEGLFRVRTPDEAAAAIDAVNANYARHAKAARALAEEHFDATTIAREILETALA